ncbi:MAG: DUF2764 family protein [Deltaproteobacteria bacterium]|nr:DUF2764 family protein [Deltaproteobacteria bacterium]
MGAYYFLMCLLPPLPSALGEKLALSFSEISRIARRHVSPSDEGLLRAQLSLIDAANWESLEQHRGGFLEGGTLSRQEMEERQNLPVFIREFLAEKERGIRRVHIYDRLWELCYAALLAEAERKGCRYLLDYIPWKIGLRNRLAEIRVRDHEGSAAEHTILSDVQFSDFTVLISQLEDLKNPLEAERFLDGERLKQIYHCQGSDPFSFDTLLALISSALIYSRWEHMQVPLDIRNFLYSGG